MVKIRTLLLAATLTTGLLTLSACETATPYQPLNTAHSTSGGYTDSQIETNRFKISFSGNAITSRETVERYLLYRAAELTLAQGYDWFQTADRYTDRKTEVFSQPDPWGCGYGPGWCGGFWGPRWNYYRHGAWGYWDPWMRAPLDVHEITRYSASVEITLGKGDKPAANSQAFDARDVLNHLGPGVQRPKS
jgi:hypothetical protein